ncbi:unnamed protein product [Penicillium bialowiezense]
MTSISPHLNSHAKWLVKQGNRYTTTVDLHNQPQYAQTFWPQNYKICLVGRYGPLTRAVKSPHSPALCEVVEFMIRHPEMVPRRLHNTQLATMNAKIHLTAASKDPNKSPDSKFKDTSCLLSQFSEHWLQGSMESASEYMNSYGVDHPERGVYG